MILKLNCKTKGHPYVLSDAFPANYFESNFTGSLLPKGWKPPRHEIHAETKPLADIIAWKDGFPLLSEQAVACFEKVASGCAEYVLFAEIRGAPFFVVNVLAVLDSKIRVDDAPSLFKLARELYGDIYVNEAIPQMVVNEGLTGFQFRDPERSETRDLFLGREVNVYPGLK